ncbi:MAG: response regulator [Treponema sp.]|jgi:chemotaxis protein histidine kinase CheA|nr:response regulator [Treponema sp.]
MAIDRDKYIAKYIDEGLENITQVEGLVFDIKNDISVKDNLATVLRALHTIKGLSRMLEFKNIEGLTHALESVFISFREQSIELTENALKLILSTLDLAKNGIELVKNTKDDAVEIKDHVKNLNSLSTGGEFSVPKTLKVSTQTKSKSIRLPTEKIDDIIKSITSLQSLEIAAKTISVDTTGLNFLIKEISAKLKTNKNKDPALTTNIRKMEKLSGNINSALKNYSLDAGNQIRGAYETVISLRTIPLSTILDTYPRYVFQQADELGKKVQLTVEGKENEIDKNIIEALSEVFMHIVRNAIDHGIETPRERLEAGKSEIGKLSITCSRESGNMKIVIADDGRGIDTEKIRQKIISKEILAENTALSLSSDELTAFIFKSGFSTSGNVSNVSGRGVGMDVVRESIENMKGSIIIDSVQGESTAFTITVPLSIAALTGFPVESGGMKFIIPSSFVDNIQMLNHDDILTVVDRSEIKYNNRLYKLFYLNQILNIKTENLKNTDTLSETVFVVILRAYDDSIALAVDGIDSMRSVILKTMPGFMESMPVFSGIVLNEDYEMISVLHIPTVIKMAKHLKTIDIKNDTKYEKLRKNILVADDSLPTREIMRDILASEGYLVDIASDGAEALEAAKAKKYDLICTDINMPVMDGFMLTENIKKNEDLSHIPIIVISSLSSEKDQKRAELLGASRYIVKNSFNSHNLLKAVKDLLEDP